mgnify:CR=1 FL=1
MVEYALYVVPTPIGNLGDMSLRSIEILQSVDLILCEDTRQSGRLLKHYEIDTPLRSYHEHNEQKITTELTEQLQAGTTMAMITDAGMPSISDPGYRLINACQEQGISYTVIPGPSAVITALVGSGMACHHFEFAGFLNVKKGKRTTQLEQAIADAHTHIFFESPHRLLGTLEILSKLAPEHPICVARELTKKFETYHKGTSQEIYVYFSERTVKGEIVLLVGTQG